MSGFLSIIVPVYNAEHTIVRCIESVLAQTFTFFELILVNDGSTDNSLEVLRSYEQKDPRIIVLDGPNGGVSEARNKGLNIARGAYWGFVDADDWIESNHFSSLIEAITKDPDACMSVIGVASAEWEHYLNSICKGTGYISLSFDEALNELTAKHGIRGYLWNKLFYTSTHRLNKQFTVCEDLEFVIRYLTSFANKRVVVVNACTYHYLIVRSDTHVRNQYGFERSFSAFLAYEESLKHLRNASDLYTRRIRAHMMHSAYEYLVAWYSLSKSERTQEAAEKYRVIQVEKYFRDNYRYGIDAAIGKEKYELQLFNRLPLLVVQYLRVKHILKKIIRR